MAEQAVQAMKDTVPPGCTQSGTGSEKGDDIISIEYGTRMPIDVIYHFINQDNEVIGYQDALANADASYCKAKEAILLNQLKNLFQRVMLRYRDEIRKIDVRIENDRALFALTSAGMWEVRKKTCEDHVAEIEKMREKFEANAPEMMIMVDSYHRGFLKGCAAQVADFMSGTSQKIQA